MSSSAGEQNATLVRSLLEILNEGGSKAVLARVEEFGDPEIEWRGVAAGRRAPGGDVVYRGYAGLKRVWEDIEEVFEEIKFEDIRVEAQGDEVVLALVEVSGTGHGSGLHLEQEMGIVYRFREGKIISGENFASHSEATESAQRLAAGARR